VDEFQSAIDRWSDRIITARKIAKLIIDARAGISPMTPAQIAKLTEQATRTKALMARSSTSGDRAKTVLDNFEGTLNRFDAGISQVDSQEKALAAQLQAMGNAAPVLDAAFPDGAVKPPVVAPVTPPVANGTGGAAPLPLAQPQPPA
jgi:hypothetical protein